MSLLKQCWGGPGAHRPVTTLSASKGPGSFKILSCPITIPGEPGLWQQDPMGLDYKEPVLLD